MNGFYAPFYKIDLTNCFSTKRPELLKYWDYTKNTINPYEVAQFSNFKVWWNCEKGHNYQMIISAKSSGCGCPRCKESVGEKTIGKILDELNIVYIGQKKFDGCINPKTKFKLPFDFYLPEYNLCIEYDGIQHFKSVEYFGGEKNYELNKIKDEIKNKFCIKNKINLLRISYKESIEEKLKEFLLSIF